MQEADVKFRQDKAKLSEDGFCPKCGEFHDQCSCEYYFVRRSEGLEKEVSRLLKQKKKSNDSKKSWKN